MSILIKRSKLIKDLKSSFFVSKKEGLNYLLKNQDKIESQIKKLLFISGYFLKLTRVNKIITSDASSIKNSIIAMSAKKKWYRSSWIFSSTEEQNVNFVYCLMIILFMAWIFI